jgi:hypothetical protein
MSFKKKVVQNSLPKELIDSKREYEKYLKVDKKIMMHDFFRQGCFFCRVVET